MDQPLITYSVFDRYCKKIKIQWDSTYAAEKACYSIRREELYSIPIEFGVSMNLIRLIKLF
jgi:hypothetical protein